MAAFHDIANVRRRRQVATIAAFAAADIYALRRAWEE